MTQSHIAFHDETALAIRDLHVAEPAVPSDVTAGSVDTDGIRRRLIEALDPAPVRLLSATGLLHIRKDRRATLLPTVLVAGAADGSCACGVMLALRIGSGLAWAAMSVSATDGDLGDDAAALAEQLAAAIERARDAGDSGTEADVDPEEPAG